MQALQRNLEAAKRGDWEAKKRVVASMQDVLQDMARKRASTNEEINALLEAGRAGIAQAIKKFKMSSGADRFQIFAVDFIEKKMDNPSSGGFFAKLFGR
jgi:DNA-directed RNA polymerase specialized sigma subunit